MSYEKNSAELDQKSTELGQNFGRVRPKIGPELGVKFYKKNLELGVCTSWSRLHERAYYLKLNAKPATWSSTTYSRYH